MKNKKALIYALAALLAVAICASPIFLIKGSEFSGSDDQAGDLVEEISPGYTPWIDSYWTPPGPETESLLFCLQAALGSGIFFYFIGYFSGRKAFINPSKREKAA